jgi:tRNA-dihydrouridine synthase A
LDFLFEIGISFLKMIDEKLSVAPMMEWTDPHYRMLLRGITKKTVLYTEMVIDEAVIHCHPSALDFFIGKGIEESPSVIQLGGNDPEVLAEAAMRCEEYCQGR